jgi:hypothetical protein
MATMASDWLKNWQSLKMFFITGWKETSVFQIVLSWLPSKIISGVLIIGNID